MPEILNPRGAEFWVIVGLIVFLAIAFWKGRGAIFGTLDAKAIRIKADLDEAARLRAEAEALLAQLRGERDEAQRRAADMLAAAQAEAQRMQAEAAAKLEEQITRRQQLAERKIAQAEQQAANDVKAAAADLAVQAAQAVLQRRLADGGQDPLLDQAVERLGSARLQ